MQFTLPFEPEVFGVTLNVHLVLEYLAFFVAFRYYVYGRKRATDPISNKNRLSIIIGAIFGALIGSRLMAYFESPILITSATEFIQLLNNKSIMGGLFGGLLGVELAKKYIHEKQSSGDLFVFPLILGIMIGRVGCFLSGTKEFTYGSITTFFTGMNLGDGELRHPIALYELLFLLLLFIFLRQVKGRLSVESGRLFKVFMVCYFSFRLLVEFIKPNTFYVFGLSSIQWLCISCLLYYSKDIRNWIQNAR